MGFSSKQIAALRRKIDQRHIRVRQSNGRELSYLEGWYVIAEANRIFGFDGWSRETLESKCVLARENRGYFMAVYTAKVRLTVQANGISIVREGHGTGEGRGEFPGEVHDTALKAAETDATKRALITFGRPFGLELYRGSQAARQRQRDAEVRCALPLHSAAPPTSPAAPNVAPTTQSASTAQELHPTAAHKPDRAAHRVGDAHSEKPVLDAGHERSTSPLPVQAAPELAPVAKYARDDTRPIPRPSTYYGREQFHDIHQEAGALVRQAAREAAKHASASMAEPIKDPAKRTGAAAPLLPVAKVSADEPTPQFSTVQPPLEQPEPISQRIDKSALPLGEPKRIRDKEHLKFVARHPCLVCGRQPSDAHHLRFAQPRALGMKVSDEFTVPLCRTHHRNLHQTGNELAWWETARVEPLPIARSLWETSHPRAFSRSRTADSVASQVKTVAADQTNPTAAGRG